MSELEKYCELALSLGEVPAQNCPQFYFRQLQKLNIDLLLTDLEVTEQLRQIGVVENKISTVIEELRKKERESPDPELSSSEELHGEHRCPSCSKHFQRESGLRLHQHLLHGQLCSSSQPPVFTLTLEP